MNLKKPIKDEQLLSSAIASVRPLEIMDERIKLKYKIFENLTQSQKLC